MKMDKIIYTIDVEGVVKFDIRNYEDVDKFEKIIREANRQKRESLEKLKQNSYELFADKFNDQYEEFYKTLKGEEQKEENSKQKRNENNESNYNNDNRF